MKRKPEIMYSEMTRCYYLVLSWRADGSAKRKIDITEQIHALLDSRKDYRP
jgi:hypothetical protein